MKWPSWLSRPKPTTPIYIPDVRRPSYKLFLRSPAVVLSVMALVASYYVLLTVTRDDHIEGPQGLWQSFARKSRARMQSRDAELLPDPPTAVSGEMVLVIVCALAANAYLSACAQVLTREQQRVEAAEESAWLAEAENPDTRAAALAKRANALAERIKSWEENDKRRKENRPIRRERITRVDVMADEVMTSMIVATAVVLSLGAGYLQLQPPNQIRGCGTAVMVAVLVGGLMLCGVDRHLRWFMLYTHFVNLGCVAALLVLITRATVFAS